jgi:hypothetical protein
MTGYALNTLEKSVTPKLHLNNSASRLNSFIIENHKLVSKEDREQKKIQSKNNKLLTGLNMKTKIIKKEIEVKYHNHADTEVLDRILKLIPITPIHTKPFSKLLRTSKRITDDGCLWLLNKGLIHRSGQNRYRAI